MVFAGTRQVYGRPDSLPVTESHLVRPTDVNGINKAAGEYYHLVYNNVFGVRACSLRLTNVYGPRQLLKHNRQGFIAWFIRLAIEDREIQIYGDGRQLRDFVYVDDAADAFLRAGATDACNGQVFNVGGAEPISHARPRRAAHRRSPASGRYRFVEWPPEKKAIDIGDFYADSSLIDRTLGWQPRTPLRDGLTRTIEFYRAHLHHYVTDAVARRRAVSAPAPIPFIDLRPGDDARRRSRRHRSRDGARLVRARTRSRGVRGRVRRGLRRAPTPSASATAPMRSRSRFARSTSARATRSSCRR